MPDLLVAAVQERHGPVAAADEPVGPEVLDGDGDGVAQVAGAPVGRGEHRVQPGDLGGHVGLRRRRREQRRPSRPISSVPSGGLPRWSITIVSPGKRRGELRHVAEMAREDARKLEDQLPFLQQREALEHLVPEDPVRVALVVDQVPEAAELRPAQELVEPLARPLGREEVDPGDHAADPRVRGRVLEHRVGVEVGAGGLDEHRRPDSGAVEQRLEVGGLERPPDRVVVVRHPGLGLPLEVPEVVVGVDDHRGHGSDSDVRAPRRGPAAAGGRRGALPRAACLVLAGVRLRDERGAGVDVLRHLLARAPRCRASRSRASRSSPGTARRWRSRCRALIAFTSSGEASKPTRMIAPGLMPAFLIDWIAPSAGGPQAE